MTPRRLMIVDDHPIVRHGIAQLLAGQPDLACDLQAEDTVSALELLRRHPVDLLIVDISLPGLSGLDLTRRAIAMLPEIKVLVLSMHEESVYAERAFSAGAHGYLNKQGATERLLAAVRRILDGGAYFGTSLEQRMLERMRDNTGPLLSGTLSSLNEREFEVLQMLGQGLTSADMALRINRSIKSIEVYRAALRRKLGARTAADLTRLAGQFFKREP